MLFYMSGVMDHFTGACLGEVQYLQGKQQRAEHRACCSRVMRERHWTLHRLLSPASEDRHQSIGVYPGYHQDLRQTHSELSSQHLDRLITAVSPES